MVDAHQQVSASLSSRLESIPSTTSFLCSRVNTGDVFAMPNSDLVPGKYEGGLKLWEGSVDLVNSLCSEVQGGRLSLLGKRVLELGCGHGLPGVYACLEGAAAVDFQDFNAEVLRCLTIRNVEHNLRKGRPRLPEGNPQNEGAQQVRFFAGDWREVHRLLLRRADDGGGRHLPGEASSEEHGSLSSSCSSRCYHVILMAETMYSLSSLGNLYDVIKKCLRRQTGVVYMAGKKHYFGVGGGTRQFLRLIDEDGVMEGSLLAEIADGSSNVREVWKISFKSPA
ncbi:unnamed protein product [Spirodela intermedia]|uniref:protein-histidine N-methyltransferase n=1 Tax=Spirodela intermedia TaxID=51605 RepID=A0A7I8J0W8_SPIIN|nr:unnamed protein product [Spirodela intermedia]CAA6663689.1 unnamed protein product [Spirodela intermedia]